MIPTILNKLKFVKEVNEADAQGNMRVVIKVDPPTLVDVSWPDDDLLLCGQCFRIIDRSEGQLVLDKLCPFDRYPGPHQVQSNRTKTVRGTLMAVTPSGELLIDNNLYVRVGKVGTIKAV